MEAEEIHTKEAAAYEGTVCHVSLSYKGRNESTSVRGEQTLSSLFDAARERFELPMTGYSMKLILKGKALRPEDVARDVFGERGGSMAPTKLMVMASALDAVAQVKNAVSDRSVASFAAEHGSRKSGVVVSVGARQGKMRK